MQAGRWGSATGYTAGLLDLDGFDPGHFHLTDADAAAMDPQALLLLEETLFALCDAGYAPDEVKGRDIGVYVGGRTRHAPDEATLARSRNPVVAVGQNYLAANLSHHFDLRGPSTVVDTACSSALVALHHAAQALRSGDIEAAVVAGITLLPDAGGHRLFDRRGLLNTGTEFHVFDRRAHGFTPAEGVGILLLKPLAAAEAAGDRVHAVLKAVAVNNDGRTAGPATPNPGAQRGVMARALAKSGVTADDVTYIETNAAGSQIPDLIELKAIAAVYRDGSDTPCSLGSVKPTSPPAVRGGHRRGHQDRPDAPQPRHRALPQRAAAPGALRPRRDAPALRAHAGPLARRPARRRRLQLRPSAAPTPTPSWPDGRRQGPGRREPLERPRLRRRRLPTAGPERFAIIGMAGHYPGADDLAAFWTNLKDGRDSVREVPARRWTPGEGDGSRWGGFLDDVGRFDADFFRISRPEAEITDPQERWFLRTCWEAIEDSGYTPAGLAEPKGPDRRRAVGVFAGAMHKDYTLVAAEADAPVPLSLNQGQIANRVSFVCDFHGPSMTVDTLCSSSLTAVHLAVESLRRGECEVALAGGVNLSLHPGKYRTYGAVGMHSSDGRCRSFGEGGDGYVSAEGVGAVVIKPLAAAEADGDHIYAVISGTAVNHVGAVSGFSVPSPVGQAAVISAAFDAAGVDARSIGYLEAHGTGTPWRPHRDPRPDHRLRPAHPGPRLLRPRLGQVQHRARGVRRRCRGPHQGGAATAPPHPGALPARGHREPAARPRRDPLQAPARHRGVAGAARGAAPRGPQLLRGHRSGRAHHPRGVRAPRRRRAVPRHRDPSPYRCRRAPRSSCGSSSPRLRDALTARRAVADRHRVHPPGRPGRVARARRLRGAFDGRTGPPTRRIRGPRGASGAR